MTQRPSQPSTYRPIIVGIGRINKDFNTLRSLIQSLNKTINLSYILVDHTEREHEILKSDLFTGSKLTVMKAHHNQVITPGVIYLCPHNRDIILTRNRIQLRVLSKNEKNRTSIDRLFSSIAYQYKERSIGILLSGNSPAGIHGLKAIKDAGGSAFIHAHARVSQHDTAFIKFNTSAKTLETLINKLATLTTSQNEQDTPVSKKEKENLSRAITLIKNRKGTDFSAYKEATLHRQLNQHMHALQVKNFSQFMKLLEHNEREIDQLSSKFLISVTSFFRNPESFFVLHTHLATLLSQKRRGRRVRVWVPACATGEEAYSIAMLFHEILGDKINDYDIKVFATDIDSHAYDKTRFAVYTQGNIENIPELMLKSYFEEEGQKYKIKKHIRELVIPAKHDVLNDPPFVRVDLISCRNFLIYLKPQIQKHILDIFHYSLVDNGILYLGKSENIEQNSELFAPIDNKHKLFKRTQTTSTRFPSFRRSYNNEKIPMRAPLPSSQEVATLTHQNLAHIFAPASILINEKGDVLYFFGDVNRFIFPPPGSPSFNIYKLIHPQIKTQLRIAHSRLNHNAATTVELTFEIEMSKKPHCIQLTLSSLPLPSDELGYLICLKDTPFKQPQDSGVLPRGKEKNRVEYLEQELNDSRLHLQAVIEELEASNEELRSINEGLYASTEEQQASNEELEAANEELQSTNEELSTVNEELRVKTNELAVLNEDLENIQNSVNIATLVLDEEFRVTRYSSLATKLFGIVPSDLGQPLTEIPTHVHLPEFHKNLRRVLHHKQRYVCQVDGTHASYLLQITPLSTPQRDRSGLIISFSDISELAEAKIALEHNERQLRLITETLQEVIWMSTPGVDEILYISPTYEKVWGRTLESLYSNPKSFIDAVHVEDQPRLLANLANHRKGIWNEEYRVVQPNGDTRWVHDQGAPIHDENGNINFLVGSVVDITERKQADLKLAENEIVFRSIFNNSGAGICIINPKERIIKANPALCSMLGYSETELHKKHFTEITPPAEKHEDLFGDILNGKRGSHTVEKRFLHKTGPLVWAALTLTYTKRDNVDDSFFVGILTDISQQKATADDAFVKANYDSLTGLANRNMLLARLEHQVAVSSRDKSHFHLIFIDLDAFKDVNDYHGHIEGDAVLKETAKRLKNNIRNSDTVARYGGDEFVVLTKGSSENLPVEIFLDKILDSMHIPFHTNGHTHLLSASIGVACYPEDGINSNQLIQHADMAMYRAKQGGRNRFCFYDTTMNTEVVRRSKIRQGLAHALENNGFVLYYQPIIDLKTNLPVAVEALLRWPHKDDGLLEPEQFIHEAERTGLINALGYWVIESASKQILLWRDTFPKLRMSINISPLQFTSKNMSDGFIKHLPERNLSHLIFEITETALATKNESTSAFINTIREKGGLIAIDDFGKGFSALSYLREIPLDIIKIDKHFLDAVSTDQRSQSLVSAILSMAESLGVQTVAEGTESSDQVTWLKSSKCNYAQGYQIARPMPAHKLLSWLNQATANVVNH